MTKPANSRPNLWRAVLNIGFIAAFLGALTAVLILFEWIALARITAFFATLCLFIGIAVIFLRVLFPAMMLAGLEILSDRQKERYLTFR